jgi:hypothetical protein
LGLAGICAFDKSKIKQRNKKGENHKISREIKKKCQEIIKTAEKSLKNQRSIPKRPQPWVLGTLDHHSKWEQIQIQIHPYQFFSNAKGANIYGYKHLHRHILFTNFVVDSLTYLDMANSFSLCFALGLLVSPPACIRGNVLDIREFPELTDSLN